MFSTLVVLPPIGSPLKSAGFHHPSRHALGVDGDASQLPPTTAPSSGIGGGLVDGWWLSSRGINPWKSMKIIGNQ